MRVKQGIDVNTVAAAISIWIGACITAGMCVRAAETTILEAGREQGRLCAFPVVRARNVYVLPGVPELLRQKWQVRPCSMEQSRSDLGLARQLRSTWVMSVC